MNRLLILIPFILILASCETMEKQAGMMKPYEGSYALSSYNVGGLETIDEIPVSERALYGANVTKYGDAWIFEYTIPFEENGTMRYPRLVQRFVWDQALGDYFFYHVSTDDVAIAGLDASCFHWGLIDGKVILKYGRGQFSSSMFEHAGDPSYVTYVWSK